MANVVADASVLIAVITNERKDGQTFIISPEITNKSPLDVNGIDVDLSEDEIIAFVREGRKYG